MMRLNSKVAIKAQLTNPFKESHYERIYNDLTGQQKHYMTSPARVLEMAYTLNELAYGIYDIYTTNAYYFMLISSLNIKLKI